MWHCSVSFNGVLPTPAHWERAAEIALGVVSGVGIEKPFAEAGRGVLHMRRYLSPEEAERVGGAVDIRGTPEHAVRAERAKPYLPIGWLEAVGEAP